MISLREQHKINYQTAAALYTSRCPHHAEFPYKLICSTDEIFLLVDIPIEDLQIDEVAWRTCCSENSNTKILTLQNITNHDPIWVFFAEYNGIRWIPKQSGKIRIVDGSHRTIAKIRNGIITTKAFFPKTQYDKYRISKHST